MSGQKTDRGVGFIGALALLLIGLKLTGHIDVSWWWVLAPLWLPTVVAIVLLLVVLLLQE